MIQHSKRLRPKLVRVFTKEYHMSSLLSKYRELLEDKGIKAESYSKQPPETSTPKVLRKRDRVPPASRQE